MRADELTHPRKLDIRSGILTVPSERERESVAGGRLVRIALFPNHFREMDLGVARCSLIGTQLVPRQMKFETIGRLLIDRIAHAILHIRDSLGGERVGAQVRRRVILVDSSGLLQAFKERGHGTDVEVRILERLKSDPVGLALEVTAI